MDRKRIDRRIFVAGSAARLKDEKGEHCMGAQLYEFSRPNPWALLAGSNKLPEHDCT